MFKSVENGAVLVCIKMAPRPGFEPGIPKEPALKAGAIPDYATVAIILFVCLNQKSSL
jgi:hypothetical protein